MRAWGGDKNIKQATVPLSKQISYHKLEASNSILCYRFGQVWRTHTTVNCTIVYLLPFRLKGCPSRWYEKTRWTTFLGRIKFVSPPPIQAYSTVQLIAPPRDFPCHPYYAPVRNAT